METGRPLGAAPFFTIRACVTVGPSRSSDKSDDQRHQKGEDDTGEHMACGH